MRKRSPPHFRLHLLAMLCAFIFSAPGLVRADEQKDPNDTQSPAETADALNEIPRHESAPSRWSVSFRMAQDRVPTQSAVGQIFQFAGEWILPFQKSGLFSIGGHFGSFPIRDQNSGLPYPIYENTLGGLQLRYQYRYADYALIVPTIYLNYDYYRLRLGGEGIHYQTGSSAGVGGGIMINLGALDRSTAREAYQSIHLSRAYLTLEAQTVSIAADTYSVSGAFYFVGLRTEFD